ncbi:MAG: hypothetical protein HeimC2_00320 [Candidatus Heimdallarchaeota archaeon LC_2]|nr:MAG: hypothetical protein HeimC2_00320 [Candidatus Heimdallarchaeota archaeon LC_2]
MTQQQLEVVLDTNVIFNCIYYKEGYSDWIALFQKYCYLKVVLCQKLLQEYIKTVTSKGTLSSDSEIRNALEALKRADKLKWEEEQISDLKFNDRDDQMIINCLEARGDIIVTNDSDFFKEKIVLNDERIIIPIEWLDFKEKLKSNSLVDFVFESKKHVANKLQRGTKKRKLKAPKKIKKIKTKRTKPKENTN